MAPCPEQDALDAADVETATARAVAGGIEQGLVGKALTPFLLARIAEELGPRALGAR